MVKNKKTIEELLNKALVPNKEQPYEVPYNWVWTNIKSINKPKKRSIQLNKFAEEIFELYSVPSYPNGIPDLVRGDEIGSSKQIVDPDNILLCKINPRINRVWKVSENKNNDRQLASTEWIVIENNKINPDYLLYLLKSPYFRKALTSNVSGVGGSLTRARPKEVENYPIPLPPLNEQKRIADKVEWLLNKIDEAKQLIEEAKESFELRRAAILDKAFRGGLSKSLHVKEKKGINENKIELNYNNEEFYELPYNWRWASLESVCDTITDGDHQAPPKSEKGIPFLVISNINKGVLDFQKTRFVSKEYYNELHDKRKPKIGDILYSVTGSYGIPVFVDTDKEFCFQRHIAILKPSEEIRSKYLYYILKSRLAYKQATNYATGTAQLTVPLSGLRKIKIPLPSLNEQNYIVGIIERIFNKQAYAEKFCTISNENIEVLKQSILSKAFKGELETNNPSEENAIELLKQVLQEKVK